MSTGSYAVNGVELTLQPTEHRWMPRDPVDIDGDAHAVYHQIHQYEMRWGLMTPAEYNQIYLCYLAVSSTGTMIVDLPEYGANRYYFKSYTGCTAQEPYYGGWFTENMLEVVWLIDNIRV